MWLCWSAPRCDYCVRSSTNELRGKTKLNTACVKPPQSSLLELTTKEFVWPPWQNSSVTHCLWSTSTSNLGNQWLVCDLISGDNIQVFWHSQCCFLCQSLHMKSYIAFHIYFYLYQPKHAQIWLVSRTHYQNYSLHKYFDHDNTNSYRLSQCKCVLEDLFDVFLWGSVWLESFFGKYVVKCLYCKHAI